MPKMPTPKNEQIYGKKDFVETSIKFDFSICTNLKIKLNTKVPHSNEKIENIFFNNPQPLHRKIKIA